MKKFLISASVAGIVLVGAITFISITSDDVATAQPAPSTDSFPDIGDDTTIGSLVDTALDRLQSLGVLTPEAVDQINDALGEATIDIDETTVGDVKEFIAGLDWDAMAEEFQREIEGLDLESLELPDGWEIPEELTDAWLDQDWLDGFSFDTFEFPEDLEQFTFDFELPDGFHPEEFGFHGDLFGDLDLSELRDAFENGTLDELFDFDMGAFEDGFEWFEPWLDEATASVNAATA